MRESSAGGLRDRRERRWRRPSLGKGGEPSNRRVYHPRPRRGHRGRTFRGRERARKRGGGRGVRLPPQRGGGRRAGVKRGRGEEEGSPGGRWGNRRPSPWSVRCALTLPLPPSSSAALACCEGRAEWEGGPHPHCGAGLAPPSGRAPRPASRAPPVRPSAPAAQPAAPLYNNIGPVFDRTATLSASNDLIISNSAYNKIIKDRPASTGRAAGTSRPCRALRVRPSKRLTSPEGFLVS